MRRRRRICFVTGTRAEFGLMRTVLRAIEAHRALQLQLIVTGMHLDPRHGRSLGIIRRDGWSIDAIVPWKQNGRAPLAQASHTGSAMAALAAALEKLDSDVVMVVGDRIEAFAAAAAGHIGQRIVAHVHGGDRAEGVIDDSLRHAITKLAHIHFPATRQSAQRIIKLGEDRNRVHCVGTPGIDDIKSLAAPAGEMRQHFPRLRRRRYALVVLHPLDADDAIEHRRAEQLLTAVRSAGVEQVVAIYPNSDPGCDGIIRCWQRRRGEIAYLLPNVPRELYLALLRDSAMLIGNSSSGIIEAASYGVPVVDVGDRQRGRERSENVTDVPYGQKALAGAVRRIWNRGRPVRFKGRNVYGRGGAGERIARVLAEMQLDRGWGRKLITY